MLGVDLDLEVQPVVDQQHCGGLAGITLPPGELTRIGEGRHECSCFDPVLVDVGMASFGQRRNPVEEVTGPGDHAVSSGRIVGAGFGQVAKRIGAVQRVVERAPTGVGSVECIASVHHRHDELRSGRERELGVDVRGGHAEVRTFGYQVADLLEEGAVLGRIVRLTTTGLVPSVDGGLKLLAPFEQLPVAGSEVSDETGETGPEPVGVDTGAGQRLVLHQLVEWRTHGEALDLDVVAVSHVDLP